MNTAFKFSLLIFWPVLAAFLLPALFLLPSVSLMALISLLDPTIRAAELAGYAAWSCAPALAAAVLVLAGMRLYPVFARQNSRLAALLAIWAIFSLASFLAVWFGFTVLTSVGASDYSPVTFLRWTAGVAAVLTLVFQPGIIFWLFIAWRLANGFHKASIARAQAQA